MRIGEKAILAALDSCCEAFTFPMLDNGYVYLAATRMAVYRSAEDWAIVIEVLGFSPRSGMPDIQIYTFGSRLLRQRTGDNFASQQAYENYLSNNPSNESAFAFPIEESDWQDPDDCEQTSEAGHTVLVRGMPHELPGPAAYEQAGIELINPARPQTFELCRYLASVARDEVLATPQERRLCVPPELVEILVLDEWRHPDLLGEERPSTCSTFKAIANVISSGDLSLYRAVEEPNTHWANWPEGGTL